MAAVNPFAGFTETGVQDTQAPTDPFAAFDPAAGPEALGPSRNTHVPTISANPDKSETIYMESSDSYFEAPPGSSAVLADMTQDSAFDDESESSSVLDETQAVAEKQAAYLALVANAYGLVDDKDIAPFIAARSKALVNAQRHAPEYVKAFGQEFEAAEGFFESAGVMINNPRAIGRLVVTQSPNSILPLLSGFAGAKTGAAVGAVAGAAAGSAVPVLGTAVGGSAGAVVGGVVGFGTGSFAASSVVEIGAWMDQQFQERGVDMSDPNQILLVLQDDALMNEIRDEAERKGITTAAVDTLFAVTGVKLLSKIKKNAAKAGAGIAFESAGEGVGEAAGQFAAVGEVNQKEVFLEVVSGLAQSSGQTAIAGSITGGKKIAEKVKPKSAPAETKVETSPEATKAVADKVDTNAVSAAAEIETVLNEVEKGDVTPEEGKTMAAEITAGFEKQLAVEIETLGPSPEVRDDIIKGRVAKLDTDISSIDKEVDALEGQIAARKEAGRPTKRVENQVSRLLNRRESMDEIRANLLTAEDKIIAESEKLVVTERDVAGLEAQKGVVEIKGSKLATLENQSLRKQERALAKGLREGATLAKKDVKAAQQQVISVVNSSGLSAADKSKFLNSVRAIQTSEQFAAQLPKLKSRIGSLFEKQAVRGEKARINKVLSRKKIKPKIVSGKKQGNFDAEVQRTLESLQGLSRVSGEVNKTTGDSEASRLLAERIESGVFDPLGNALLNMKARPNSVSSSELKRLAEALESLTSEGRSNAAERILSRQIQAQKYQDAIIDFVGKGESVDAVKQTGVKASGRALRQNARQFLAELADGWDDLLDRILPGSVARELEIGAEIQVEKGIHRRLSDELTAAAAKAYDLKDAKKLNKELINSSRVFDHGVFQNTAGKDVRLEMSRSQARKVWMEWQDPTMRRTLTSEEGNSYSAKMLNFMFTDILDPADKDFARAQLVIYGDFYKEINTVYSRVFGIDLDRNQFFSPIRREADANEIGIDEFGRDIQYRNALASAASLKIRQRDAVQPIMKRSDIEVFNRHVLEMARFIALREKTQLLNAVFGDADVRRTLKVKKGESFNNLVSEHLESFSGGGSKAADIVGKVINYLNRNFAVSQLGGKGKIGLTQTASVFAYAEFVPTHLFLKGVAQFMANPVKVIQTLGKAEFMQSRSVNVDVSAARDGKTFNSKTAKKFLAGQAKMADVTLIATKFGDRFAIYAGGWSVYQQALKETGSEAKALEAFSRATSKTQQSRDVDQQSLWQKGNPVMRSMTMFMSGPIAQYRGEVRAVRKYFNKGEINKRQFAKLILIYHFVIPNLFQALSNGLVFGEWNEEDQLRASLLGSLNGVPLIGELINAVYREFQGKHNQSRDIFKWAGPLIDSIDDIIDAWDAGTDGDWDEMTEALVDLGANTGALHGLPGSQTKNIAKGLKNLEDGEPQAAVMRFLGWPSSVVEDVE